MTNRAHADDPEQDPTVRPPSGGESQEANDAELQHPGESTSGGGSRRLSWRERYPGWETFEGRPNDPRFESSRDPADDPRYDTHLNPATVLTTRVGAVTWVLFIVLGVAVMVLIGLLMYYRFQTPSPRSPARPNSELIQPGQPPIKPLTVVLSDSALPLRTRHSGQH